MIPTSSGPQRRAFLSWAEKQEGKPCLWAAKGPEVFDCSGLVVCGYQAAGCTMFDPDFTNTDKLWNMLPNIELPCPGDIVLYGGFNGDVDHVMIWWGDNFVYGACGATPKIDSVAKAQSGNHQVRLQKLHYRRDFRGFRRSPLDIKDLIDKQRMVA